MRYLCLLIGLLVVQAGFGQEPDSHSVARRWNEALLAAIRNDFARPTVHARNLFHTSMALYDAWAAYDPVAVPYLLGRSVAGFPCPFEGIAVPEDRQAAQEEAMSYAAYRLLFHRFRDSPGGVSSTQAFDQLMQELGYDISFSSDDYTSGNPAALGNYIANALIAFGQQDGSNEYLGYENQYYQPANPPMRAASSGTQGLTDPNRWQPLSFSTFEDQAGFQLPGRVPPFLGAEWGQVVPFALRKQHRTSYWRDGHEYYVYHDPGEPAYSQFSGGESNAEYCWGHSMVAIWSSHLDPSDSVLWDISPASLGNVSEYSTSLKGLRDFYQRYEGGDTGQGRRVNPATGEPYSSQVVPRGDYTRVLAEFWADGPASETPPGHWFTILNYVNDHPELIRKFKGEGDVLDDLEWDVKAYFVLGGAVHDAAVAAWSIKGWYDYVRPISAIRYMAERGQSSDPNLPNYEPDGIPLEEGLIEVVQADDPLAGDDREHVGKIKLKAWRGHDYIAGPGEAAGVGWILAENWMPYQRATFVTPPFAGYVSGHSTFSRAAAEVLTLFTGDAYFPGGVGEFVAKKNEFLEFEAGPSQDVVLQWATYRDASDQCSLSRIWGGIHPPVDDIPGRLIGIRVGHEAFAFAERYFQGDVITSLADTPNDTERLRVYPNPLTQGSLYVGLANPGRAPIRVQLLTPEGKTVLEQTFPPAQTLQLPIPTLPPGVYVLTVADRPDTPAHYRRVLVE